MMQDATRHSTGRTRLEVKCGGGLTQKHIDEAVAFLRDGQDPDASRKRVKDEVRAPSVDTVTGYRTLCIPSDR